MKNVITVLTTLFLTTGLFAQQKINISELEFLNNTSWSGDLMYVNYSDGKEVSLKTTMQIEIKKDKIIIKTQYTDEPSANTQSGIKLKKGGTFLGNEEIIERSNLENGKLKIVTLFKGKDNNKPATLIKTYLIGEKEFSVTKTAQYEDSNKELVRNRYTYNRI